mmetsp:Transcript_18404/g.36780  ORF Transcript_18404/g.36780 Transcript_18404/m.36780 type:complete len:229 (+) Transcript_18404:142-828(+)
MRSGTREKGGPDEYIRRGPPPGTELLTSKWCTCILLLASGLGPSFGLRSYSEGSEKFAWLACALTPLSHIGSFTIAFNNSSFLIELTERSSFLRALLMMSICILKFAFWPWILFSSENEATSRTGKFFMVICLLSAIRSTISMPTAFCMHMSQLRQHSDAQRRIRALVLPFMLGFTAYTGASCFRCISLVDEMTDVLEVCRNPILPAFLVNLYPMYHNSLYRLFPTSI